MASTLVLRLPANRMGYFLSEPRIGKRRQALFVGGLK